MVKITISNILTDVVIRTRKKNISYYDIVKAMRKLDISSQKEEYSKLEKEVVVQFFKAQIAKENSIKIRAKNATLKSQLEIINKQLEIANKRILFKLDEILHQSSSCSLDHNSNFEVESKSTSANADQWDPIISLFAEHKKQDNKKK